MLIAADRTWIGGRLRPGLAVRLGRGAPQAGAVAGSGGGGGASGGLHVHELRVLGRDRPDLTVPFLLPGLTDLQVNGGGGVLFNADPSPDGIAAIIAAHRRLGTAAILPTLISDAPEVMDAAAEAVIAARGMRGLAGIHLEGPHLAPERRGTHEARFIRPLDARSLGLLARLRAAGVPVLLTLAPETAPPGLLARARALGVVLSAGHSMADADQTRAALDAGVTMFTHLFNAMPPMTSRAPGIAAAAILSDAWCGLIADGIHVSAEMLRIAMAARPRRDRCILVSDAMPTVGGPATFDLYGRRIALRGGRLVNDEGALAGAHLWLAEAVRRLVAMTGIAPARAFAMAGDLPRRAMGLAPLRIRPGLPAAELLALDEDLRPLPLPG